MSSRRSTPAKKSSSAPTAPSSTRSKAASTRQLPQDADASFLADTAKALMQELARQGVPVPAGGLAGSKRARSEVAPSGANKRSDFAPLINPLDVVEKQISDRSRYERNLRILTTTKEARRAKGVLERLKTKESPETSVDVDIE